jgi:drug/metabolite transporter (DMT)-like permease
LGPAFAFLAACAFALGTVLQQKGTLSTTSGSGDSHWLIQILHEPVWLAGLLLQASGWVLQAVALDKGPLMAVQAITTLSLVIALPFGWWLTHQHIDRWVVLGAVAVVVGIVVFLSVGSPHGGTTHPSARTWWIACLVTLVLVLVLAMAGLGRKRQGAVRAVLFGAAAGFGFALQTAVTKDFVTEIGGGVVALLADWSVYVLIASGPGQGTGDERQVAGANPGGLGRTRQRPARHSRSPPTQPTDHGEPEKIETAVWPPMSVALRPELLVSLRLRGPACGWPGGI